MSTNKKFRIQNGVDIHGGGLSIDDVTVIGADGKVVASAIADAVAGLTASDIADLQAQVSAILGTSPETLDTLQEIVAAFEGADSTLTGSVAQNAADIATINTTLTNGVATPTDVADLQSQVTSNDADIASNAAAIAAANSRTSGISTSSGSSNIQMAAEVDMDSNKVTNMADPTAAQDAATKAYVDAASTGSSSSLATETAARIAGDSANEADATAKADAAEASAKAHADAGDASLQGQIDIIVGSSPATLDTLQEIVTAFENADSTLTGAVAQNSTDIAAETARATAAEQVNASSISTLDAFVGDGATANLVDPSNWVGYEDAFLSATETTLEFNGTSQPNGNGVGPYKAIQTGITLPANSTITVSMNVSSENLNSTLEHGLSFLLVKDGLSPNTILNHVLWDDSTNSEIAFTSSSTTSPYDLFGAATIAGPVPNMPYVNGGDYSLSFYNQNEQIVDIYVNKSVDDAAHGGHNWVITDLFVGDASSTLSLETSASTVVGAINEVVSSVASLTSGTSSDLAAETAARIAGDASTLSSASVDATNKSTAAESSAKAHADAGDATLSSAISAEESARIAGDASLQGSINSLSSDKDSDVGDLQSQITAEASARASADTTLQGNIDVVSGRIDAILNGAGESLDTIVEVVAAFEGADGDLQTLISANSSSLTAEVARAQSAESTLQSNIDALTSSTGGDVSGLQSQIDAEEAARIAGDSDLTDSLAAEVARATAAESANAGAIATETSRASGVESSLQSQISSNDGDISALQTRAGTIEGKDSDQDDAIAANAAAISAEESRATAAEGVLTSNLSSEVSRATAAEGVIASDLATEVSRAQTAEAGLQSQIDFVKTNTDPAALDSLTEIVAAFQAADGSITGVVNSNTSRISALEGDVSTIEAWNTDNISEGSVNKYWTEQRTKDCLSGGLCITYSSVTGEIKIDETEAESSLRVAESVASDDADKLDGQEGTYYRINVYNVGGTLVN